LLHRAALPHRLGEGLKLAAAEQPADVDQRQVEAHIGLVRAEAVHGLGVRQARQWTWQRHAPRRLPDLRDEPFHQRQHLVATQERRLDVDLREFGLAVAAEVLVAEAARDLEIPLEARDHQQLLEELRGLRQRVEAAPVEAAGNEEVARTLRGRADQERGLDLQEPVAMQVAAGGPIHGVAEGEVAVHRRPAEV
jgi:hypothetical protein